MTVLLPLALACMLAPAQDNKAEPLRYLRQTGTKFVLESEIAITPVERGTVYKSTTTRKTELGDEKMTLTLRLDENNRITSAETVEETPKGKKTATLTLRDRHALLKREGTTDILNKVAAFPIVTTAPDWSDVIQLVTRYDAKKGGMQEFGGVWFHPSARPATPTFTIERLGTDKINVKDADVTLTRYQIKLRSGDYLAWADEEGRVFKILPRAQGGTPIALQGYEEATRELK
jgi:hypothetical protein